MRGQYLLRVGQDGLPSTDLLAQESRYAFGHGALWSAGPIIPVGGHGAIVGTLFSRHFGTPAIDRVSPTQVEAIIKSGGRSLFTDHWGGYVAILRGADGVVRVLRDPSGAMPCYMTTTTAGVFLSDDAGSLLRATSRRAAVDYLELARFLASPGWGGRKTCIADVVEILPGECVTIAGKDVAIEPCWSPWTFAETGSDATFEDLSNRLRATVQDCVGRWADRFGSIILGVSGGLDSSIVAAASRHRTRLHCLTMVGPDASGDERGYARIVTDAFGLKLAEHHYDAQAIDVSQPSLAHLPRAAAPYFYQDIERAHLALERNLPIDAFFAGNGGDAIFSSMRSATPLIDRLVAEGVGRGAWSTLRDISDLTGATWATVLRLALRRLRTRHSAGEPHIERSGLSATIVGMLGATFSHHPWIRSPQDALPGKRIHVANLARAVRNSELYPTGERPIHVAPLLSQPIVELCLRIPSWRWVEGGIDRAVARASFRDELPAAILDRRSKGGPDGLMHQIVRTKAAQIMSLLREGTLLRNGVIDPGFLDALPGPSGRDTLRARRLLAFGAAEAWARHWESAPYGNTGDVASPAIASH